MPTYTIRGIAVDFPFDAYQCQLAYMGKVIDALNTGKNALLESPTGTGKTLCLLCATLAWRENKFKSSFRIIPTSSQIRTVGDKPTEESMAENPKNPPILYASRTHSQLTQVIRELRTSSYRPRMCVLGSRKQTCVNIDVSQMGEGLQNIACRKLVKKKNCSHHARTAEYLSSHPELGCEPTDIEDLVKIGRSAGPCPYYMSLDLMDSADIVFLPYNYIFSKDQREMLDSVVNGKRRGVNFEGSILILDEGHNVEDVCSDSASVQIHSSLVSGCISEAAKCIGLSSKQSASLGSFDASKDAEHFAILKGLLMRLEAKISSVDITKSDFGFCESGSYIYDFLAQININKNTLPLLMDNLDKGVTLLSDEALNSRNDSTAVGANSIRLQTLSDILKTIFNKNEPTFHKSFRTHIEGKMIPPGTAAASGPCGKNVKQVANVRTLSWWCFNPGVAMADVRALGIKSILLTSGTLSPMDSFAKELKIPFEITLENSHVISADQIMVGIITKGPSGKALNSSYRTRDSPDYKQELGNAIVNFSRSIPDGLLVFFPSYSALDSCLLHWQSTQSGIWERLRKIKQLVIEPRQSSAFPEAIKDYSEKLLDSNYKGAAFFAVCRGKVSEGLDFADAAGRGVIITGIPYPMKMDAKVNLKQQYLNDKLREPGAGKGLSGDAWYLLQASRAVNQAIGRVIRHRNDYGAILLCDERFASNQMQSQLSVWLKTYAKTYNNFGEAMGRLSKFFKDKSSHFPVSNPKSLCRVDTSATPTKNHSPERGRFLLVSNSAHMASSPLVNFEAFNRGFGDKTGFEFSSQKSLSSILSASRNLPSEEEASMAALHRKPQGQSRSGSFFVAAANRVAGNPNFGAETFVAAPESFQAEIKAQKREERNANVDISKHSIYFLSDDKGDVKKERSTVQFSQHQGWRRGFGDMVWREPSSQEPLSSILAASKSLPTAEESNSIDLTQQKLPNTKSVPVNMANSKASQAKDSGLEGEIFVAAPKALKIEGRKDSSSSIKTEADIGCETGATETTSLVDVKLRALWEGSQGQSILSGGSAAEQQAQKKQRLKETSDSRESLTLGRQVKGLNAASKFQPDKGSGLIQEVKARMSPTDYLSFLRAMKSYKNESAPMDEVLSQIASLFRSPLVNPLLVRLKRYLKPEHSSMLTKLLS